MSHQAQKYMIVDSHDADDWTAEWFHEIGWVGYYFGQMEWTPYLLGTRVGSSKRELHKMTGMKFASRCDFAKKSLVPKVADAALRSEWVAALDEVRKCGKMRNDIVHNPLELNVSDMAKHGIKIDQGIRLLKRDGKILQIGDVQYFSQTMMNLHKHIIGLLERTPVTA